MKRLWGKKFVKTLVLLVAEILLNFLGIDDLADCSEFIFERDLVLLLGSPCNLVQVVVVEK